MTIAITSAPIGAARRGGVFGGLFALFGEIAGVLARVPAAARTSDEIETLSNLTDAELADLGIRRDDIVRVAFERHLG